jgi:serine/threonine protein kinase
MENISKVKEENEGGFMCFAMEMFGCSIWDLVNDRQNCPDKKFSLRCTLQLGIELTKCIRDLHKMGFIHLDIKPDNVVVSKDKGQKLYLIDYGISEEYLKEGVHR